MYSKECIYFTLKSLRYVWFVPCCLSELVRTRKYTYFKKRSWSCYKIIAVCINITGNYLFLNQLRVINLYCKTKRKIYCRSIVHSPKTKNPSFSVQILDDITLSKKYMYSKMGSLQLFGFEQNCILLPFPWKSWPQKLSKKKGQKVPLLLLYCPFLWCCTLF